VISAGWSHAGLVLVVPPSPERPRGENFDLRIDDSLRPLDELRRLLQVAAGYDASNRADSAFAIGDVENGNREYERAAELVGQNPEMRF
jgi:hypothetical protein